MKMTAGRKKTKSSRVTSMIKRCMRRAWRDLKAGPRRLCIQLNSALLGMSRRSIRIVIVIRVNGMPIAAYMIQKMRPTSDNGVT